MKPKGIIYESGKTPQKGEVVLVIPLLTKLAYNFARGVGGGLIAFVVVLVLFIYGPIVKQEAVYQFKDNSVQNTELQKETSSNLVNFAEADKLEELHNEAQSYGVETYFSLVIPKINAASNIIANVNASDEIEYTRALREGVAHAKGTYFPGQGSNIYLFSHSTDSAINVARYNAIFYLLRKLEVGDEIIVYFADEKYVYEVYDKVVVDPTDVKWLTEETNEERLVLQTCDPPGTTWNRLLVLARPVDNDS